MVRARAKFVYLFGFFQCVLSYHRSSLFMCNINGLCFHLVQIYLQKLSCKSIYNSKNRAI